MTIYGYKMTHDDGDAPCVADELLSLAICQPWIRRRAQLRDILLGIGAEGIGIGRVIYAAVIEEILGPSPDYYSNPAYQHRTDCVYEKDMNKNARHRGTGWSHDPQNAIAVGKHPELFLRRDVGKNWTSARVLLTRDFRYLGENGLHFNNCLIFYKQLRSLVEIDRFPRNITSKSVEWSEANALLRHLWKKYPLVYGQPTHPGVPPRPKDWKQHNRQVEAYRNAHPFNRAAFPEFRCVRR